MKKIATTIVIAFAICSWGYSQEANHADTIMLIVNGQEALKLYADFQAGIKRPISGYLQFDRM